MTDQRVTTFNLLRRLQEHMNTDVPTRIASKAVSAFKLKPPTVPDSSESYVNVFVYPQDPFVSEPEVRQMSAQFIQPNLVNHRFQISDAGFELAQPDAQGNYLFTPDHSQFDQVNSFYYATFTLRMFERYAYRHIPWSFGADRITIDPHAGTGANAFYSEPDRLIGFNGFVVDGERIESAQSADIVSHETAHAVLDGIRDLYNESFGLGAAAFHESFGDMAAILVALHDDSLIKRLLDWTKGDLRIDNFIASLAEQITERARSQGELLPERTIYLRNALNIFKDVPFDALALQTITPEFEILRESHSYSRVFTGAFYDILVAVYEQTRKKSIDHLAIHIARDVVGHLLVTAVELAPVGELDFSDIARAFLAADALLYEKAYTEILVKTFADRAILSDSDARQFMISLSDLPPIRLSHSVDSPESAAAFLQSTLLPALSIPSEIELKPLSAHRNDLGNIFMTFAVPRRIMLSGAQFHPFDGSHVDAFGGLTVAFDASGLLRSMIWRPVTDEDTRQIQILTADLIARGLVIGVSAGQASFYEITTPSGFRLENIAPPNTLLKNPVIADQLPGKVGDLLAFLRAWRKTYMKH
ncbi:MAG: hypothetical protein JNJ78_04585 [Anaerolineae bacterium]|nr:hypothetical protein [Anaerolineae bacterium]